MPNFTHSTFADFFYKFIAISQQLLLAERRLSNAIVRQGGQ
jgi:hypothetical protein